MDRAEHVAWCKRRALEYVDHRLLVDAVASMISDMSKHQETKLPSELAFAGILESYSNEPDRVRRWIEGFA